MVDGVSPGLRPESYPPAHQLQLYQSHEKIKRYLYCGRPSIYLRHPAIRSLSGQWTGAIPLYVRLTFDRYGGRHYLFWNGDARESNWNIHMMDTHACHLNVKLI